MNSLKGTIHIVIPVYHPPEALFRACLDSVVKQTHSDFVCILVDDGSTPGIAAICDETAANDKRFSVIHKKNEGTNYARRDGVAFALKDGANALTFVDSDDTIEPGFLAYFMGHLTSDEPTIAYCGATMIEKGERIPLNQELSGCEISRDKDEILTAVVSTTHPRFGARWSLCMGGYSASLFKDIDWDLSRVKIGEDNLISLLVAAKCKVAVYSPKPLYNYIRQSDSVTLNASSFERLEYWYAIMSRIRCYLEQNGLFSKRIADVMDADMASHHFSMLLFMAGRKHNYVTFSHYCRTLRDMKILTMMSLSPRQGMVVALIRIPLLGTPLCYIFHYVWCRLSYVVRAVLGKNKKKR